MKQRFLRLCLLPLLPFLPSAPLVPAALSTPVAAQDTSVALVETLKQQLATKEGDSYWLCVNRLESLGKNAVPGLQAGLDAGSEKVRLGCAKALLQIGTLEDRKAALKTLGELSAGARSAAVQIEAIQLYGLNEDPDTVLPILEKVFAQSLDGEVLIPLARTLWEVDHVTRARDRLIELLRSRDLSLRYEAALTLAELGYYEGGVRDILRSLKKEPTARGRRAATLERVMRMSRQLDRRVNQGGLVTESTDTGKLLKIKEKRIRELEDLVERMRGRPSSGAGTDAPPRAASSPEDALLEEIVAKVQQNYVEEKKTDRGKLLLNAAKGLVEGLDPFSVFMDAEVSRNFQQSISGEYPGIGAHVSKPDGEPLEIVRPIYGGPAYAEGIQSGDLVLEIEGLPTDELTLRELVDLLKGPKGTKVSLKVLRRGWKGPREFKITRRTVEVPSVYHESLPGHIGLIVLTQFGDRSVDEFLAALKELEKNTLAGLIIDFRNNPGGRLDAAVTITDLFVKGDLPIVTQKGRAREAEKATYPTDQARLDYPIVVLVNGGSASASEVVAGALQDFDRATLVGTRTFGKGSVQKILPLSSKAGAKLKLTVQYYYLPLDRCIHTIRDEQGQIVKQGGVEPDVVHAAEKVPAWRIAERKLLRDNATLLDYVDKHMDSLSAVVPYGGLGNPSAYPDFAKLYGTLDTHALEDDVRAVVRYHVRRRLEDQRGRQLAFDLVEDAQLQRGILELLALMGVDAAKFPEYAWLPRPAASDNSDKKKEEAEK